MVARETGRRDGVKSATRLRSSGELYRCRERAYDMAPCPNRSLSAAESNRQMPLVSADETCGDSLTAPLNLPKTVINDSN